MLGATPMPEEAFEWVRMKAIGSESGESARASA
uniref:Actin-depolymerizing factor 6 n=1 Tax=Arundo donax TaxID=35708 RepID=A0A0A9FE96_ARUDO